MLRRGVVGAASVALLGLVGVQAAPALQTTLAPSAPVAAGPVDKARAADALGTLPLRFEANFGQTDAEVSFFARSAGGTVFLTGTEAVLSVSPSTKSDVAGPAAASVVRMRPLDANPNVRPVGADRLPGVSNYLSGNDPAQWKTNVPAFGGVRYPGVYPGIDLVFHGKNKALEYDYEIAPGADPARIAVGFDTTAPVTLEANGDLVLHSPGGDIRQPKPHLYQDIDGARRPVTGAFAIQGPNRVGFDVGAYDHTRQLIIDPVVQFTAFLGGSGDDQGNGVAVDPAGNVYVSGTARSLNFPTQGTQISAPGSGNAFVSKLNPTGTALIYSTYLGPYTAAAGGPATDRGGPIAVDATGSAHITGVTTSPNFPTTPNAFDRVCGSGTDEVGNPDLNCNSNQTFTTGNTTATSNVLTTTGNTPFLARHVGTPIYSPNLPAGTTITTVTNPSTVTLSNFATATGTAVSFTIDGGVPKGDAFVTKLASDGASLTYSTYLGGSSGGTGDLEEAGNGIAVDADGIYVTGGTRSGDFPTTPNAFKTSCAGSEPGVTPVVGRTCGYSRPSSFTDGVIAITTTVPPGIDSAITSATANFTPEDNKKTIVSANIPAGTTLRGIGNSGNLIESRASMSQRGLAAGTGISFTIVDRVPINESEAYLVRIDPRQSGPASLAYSTYLGGKGNDKGSGVAIDPTSSGSMYVGGSTRSADFPAGPSSVQPNCEGLSRPNCMSRDAYVAKFNTKASGASSLAWSTFLGGTLNDDGNAIAADASGVYLAGSTSSFGFPTKNSYQVGLRGSSDGFVTKLTPNGTSLNYSTFLGGSGADSATGVAVDPSGSAHVTGLASVGFPQVGGLVQTGADGQYATKLTPAGSALAYSAIVAPLGPSGPVAATDAAGNTYVAGTVAGSFASAPGSLGASTRSGNDAYVLKLTAGVGPIVTRSSPTGGVIVGGTPVVITGLQFTGATKVFFGDTPASSFTVDSDTQITALSPPKPSGTPFAPVSITVANAQATSFPVPEATFLIGTGQPTGSCVDALCPGNAIVLKTGKVLVTDGQGSQLYDPATGTWRQTGSCGCGAYGESVLLTDGKVLLTGGQDPPDRGPAIAGSFLYNPATETWSPTRTPAGTVTTMVEPRIGHTATLLASGKVLVAGGLVGAGRSTGEARATAELFDPAAGTWTATGSMSVTRPFHAATLLDPAVGNCGSNCGKVLVAFGRIPLDASGATVEATNTAELYDPATGTWGGLFTAPGAGAIRPAAIQLKDGKVVIAGGGDVTSVNSLNARDATVVYDPAAGPNGAFQPGAPLNTRRSFNPARVLLPNGGVLLVGGEDANGPFQGAGIAEVRDPVTGRWSNVASLPNGGSERVEVPSNDRAVLLPLGPVSVCGTRCGTVLVVGPSRSETYAPPPQVAGLSVTTGPGGTEVAITGTGLASTTSVRFGDTNAASFTPDALTPDSRLVAVAPVHAGGAVGVVVNNPGGSSAPATFTFLAPPTVSGVSPAAGPTGGATAVTVTGTNFTAGSTVRFGATAATNVTVVSPTSITATSPAGTGPVNVTVTTSDGTSPTGAGNVFTYTAAPTVTGISPAAGPAAGATTVTVTGTNFTPGSTVSFGTTPATAVAFVSATSLTATSPAGTGTVNVTVTTAGGTSPVAAGAVFTYTPPVPPAPTVTGIAPASGPPGGGTAVTVTGTNFTAGSTVSFGATPATNVTFVSATSLTATSPAGTGTANVTVTTAGGTSPVTAGAVFTYAAPVGSAPTVTGISNGSGPPAGGTTVTITGTGFTPGSTVLFGTTPASNVTFVSPTQLTATSPPGTGPVNITVTTPGGTSPATAGAVFAFVGAGSTFAPLSPARLWDSRSGPGPVGLVGAGQSRDITVTGVGGVPVSGVTAVVLNVTAVNPTAGTFVTAWPTGETRPNASNLNVPPNDIRPNLVIVKVGAGGKVSFYNDGGNVNLLADVAGWYGADGGQRYTAVSPARVWDSRSGPGPAGRIGAAQTRDVTVTGIGGVPATGVTAVVLNVTAAAPSASTFVTAWPTGEAQPNASNLNVPARDVRPNLVIVKVGAGGRVSFFNETGTVDLIADVAGYYGATGSSFTSVSPARLWDSRSTPGPTGRIGAGQSRDITVTGVGGVPATGVTAVVLNVTAAAPTAGTFITVWPTGEAKPNASNLNVPPGDVRPNLVIVKVGADGKVSFNNDAGDVDLIADVAGWYGAPGT